jgi:hypothetical protein
MTPEEAAIYGAAQDLHGREHAHYHHNLSACPERDRFFVAARRTRKTLTVHDITDHIAADRNVFFVAHDGLVVSVPLPMARKMVAAIEQMAREHDRHFKADGQPCAGCAALVGLIDHERLNA